MILTVVVAMEYSERLVPDSESINLNVPVNALEPDKVKLLTVEVDVL
jgi:hypothetical protein